MAHESLPADVRVKREPAGDAWKRFRGVRFADLRSGHPGPGSTIRDVPAGGSPGRAW